MGLKVVTAPTVEPVTLTEAKLHQRVDLSADDDLVTMWISAIREHAEHLTERALAPATFCLYLDAFPCDGIEIPRPPLTAISSIQYYDTTGTLVSLDGADYYVDDAQEAPKRDHLHIAVGLGDLARNVHALADGEHGALVVASGHRQDQLVEQPRRARHQVFMPQRHRVEGAGVDGGHELGLGHGRLLWRGRAIVGCPLGADQVLRRSK